MKRIGFILAALLLTAGNAYAQGTSLPISQWPIPASGSVNFTTGDLTIITRNGVSSKVIAGWGGTCGMNLWVSSINAQGVPACTQPFFSNIGGFLNVNQIGGLFTDGQIMIGSSGTGVLSASTITPGAGITIVNGHGSITISAGAAPGSVALGTSASFNNPARSGDVTTGLFSPIGTTVAIAAAGVQKLTVNATGVGIGSAAPRAALDVNGAIYGTTFNGSGAGLTNIGTAAIVGTLPVANGGTGTTSLSNIYIPYVTNQNAGTNLAKWRLALSKVQDGTSNARILFVGDSTTSGIGSTLYASYPNVGSFPTRLAGLMNFYQAPVANSLAIPPSNFAAYVDNRWTAGSGWSLANFGAANGATYTGTNPGGNLVFTGGVNANRYYVYYLVNSGLGSITATATGGSPVVISEAGSIGIQRTLVSAATASANNTLTMSCSGACYVTAVEPYLSTASQVLVGNAGVASAATANWVANPSSFGGGPFIEAVAPDLCVISLGINDGGNSVATATYIANMQTLITACQVSGDVIILDWPPSQNAPNSTYEALYAAALPALAVSNNATYLSIYNRFGGTYAGSNWMFDSVHGNDDFYWDEARFINSVLMRQ
jgi:GDSL-like lipase/acylhydrolase family protein